MEGSKNKIYLYIDDEFQVDKKTDEETDEETDEQPNTTNTTNTSKSESEESTELDSSIEGKGLKLFNTKPNAK